MDQKIQSWNFRTFRQNICDRLTVSEKIYSKTLKFDPN